MLVRWTAPAAEDPKRITRYIHKDNPTAARNVAKTIFDAGNSLRGGTAKMNDAFFAS
jgi:plasmid stabilization system protein ParE